MQGNAVMELLACAGREVVTIWRALSRRMRAMPVVRTVPSPRRKLIALCEVAAPSGGTLTTFAAVAKAALGRFPDGPWRRALAEVADYTVRRVR